MHPYITILGREMPVYGLCACAGFLAVLFCVSMLARSRRMDIEDPIISILVCIIPLGLGGSLLFGLTNLEYFQGVLQNWDAYDGIGQHLAALLKGFSGIVFFGGLLGALLGVLAYCKVMRKPVPVYLDMFVVCAPLFHAFGRVGCFFGGCCFGIEFPFGFPLAHAPAGYPQDATLFPIQLLEAALNLVIFLVLLRLFLRNGRLVSSPYGYDCDYDCDYDDGYDYGYGCDFGPCGIEPETVGDTKLFGNGRLIWAYFLMYGTVRFLDEFLRGDAYRGFLGCFSTSQWISLVLVTIAVIALVRWRRASG